MTKVPVFHYTPLDNFYEILSHGQLHSRTWLDQNTVTYEDISIDPEQPIRAQKGLLTHVPLFLGFYALWRDNENYHIHLANNYDDPKIQNPSFFGSLNKILRMRLGESYQRIILLLIKWDVITEFADRGYVRYFTDIAVKPDADEYDCPNSNQLLSNIDGDIEDDRNLKSEIDILDDGKKCIHVPNDLEAIIVDNEEIKSELTAKAGTELETIPIYVHSLPRHPLP